MSLHRTAAWNYQQLQSVQRSASKDSLGGLPSPALAPSVSDLSSGLGQLPLRTFTRYSPTAQGFNTTPPPPPFRGIAVEVTSHHRPFGTIKISPLRSFPGLWKFLFPSLTDTFCSLLVLVYTQCQF